MNDERDERGAAGGSDADAGEPQLVTLARFSGHGLTLALSMGLFLLGGWWLDGKLGTTPLLTIVGALTGAGAGFYSLLHHMIFFPARKAREEKGMDGKAGGEAEDR